jgi:flagellar biosynthesis/type III secretory pathway M-ring protein FliF/YscJ
MPAAMKQLWERAFGQFRSFSMAQRVALVGGGLALVIVLMLFSRWSG